MKRACEHCGYEREVGSEIGERGVAHCYECSRKITNAGARRRYYQKRGIAEGERICPRCGYPFTKVKRKRSRYCEPCRLERRAAYDRWYRVTHRPQAREYERAFRERIYSDPYLLEQFRAQNRERAAKYRAADPERYRQNERRTYAKRRNDAKRWRKWLDEQAERTRARRLERGQPVRVLTQKTYEKRNGTVVRRLLPVQPLILNMREYLDGDEQAQGNLAFASGVPTRRIQGILNGEFQQVTLTTADKLCAGMQVPLSLVYPEAS